MRPSKKIRTESFLFAGRKGKDRNGFSLFQSEGVRGLFQQSGGFFRHAFPRKNQRRAGRKQPARPRGNPPHSLFRRQKFDGELFLIRRFASISARPSAKVGSVRSSGAGGQSGVGRHAVFALARQSVFRNNPIIGGGYGDARKAVIGKSGDGQIPRNLSFRSSSGCPDGRGGGFARSFRSFLSVWIARKRDLFPGRLVRASGVRGEGPGGVRNGRRGFGKPARVIGRRVRFPVGTSERFRRRQNGKQREKFSFEPKKIPFPH